MKVVCRYIVFMLFIYNFNIFNIDAEKPFSGTLNKVYVCMYVCLINVSTSMTFVFVQQQLRNWAEI